MKIRHFSLAASLVFATAFTISCGDHGLSDLLETSSSSDGAQDDSSSSIAVSSSSSDELSSSSTELSSSSAEPSSSSVAVSSSSSVPSSSSVAVSSSSSVPSSSSLGGGYSSSYGSITYKGQTYRTVVIGTQTWMAENLNYEVEGGRFLCNEYDDADCSKYGKLYNWVTAMDLPPYCGYYDCDDEIQPNHRGICPYGWHIPSDGDWEVLIDYAGGSETAGTKLKAASDWNWNYDEYKSGDGTDDYGFSALPGGYYDDNKDLGVAVGYYGYWWSTSKFSSFDAYGQYTSYILESVALNPYDKSFLFSVRCLQD